MDEEEPEVEVLQDDQEQQQQDYSEEQNEIINVPAQQID